MSKKIVKREDGMEPYWNTFDRMFDEMRKELMMPFGYRTHQFIAPFTSDEMAMPATNLVDNGDHYKAELEMPGIKKEDVEINVTPHELEIKAESKNETQEEKKGRYLLNERREVHYYRSFEIPEEIVPENAKASFENGVLSITMPKKSPAKASAGVKLKVE